KLAVQRQPADDRRAIRLEAAVHVVQMYAGDEANAGVEHPREGPPGHRVATLRLPAGDEVEALLELGEQVRDLGRVVLEVPVHGHDHLAVRVSEAGGQRRGLAEV